MESVDSRLWRERTPATSSNSRLNPIIPQPVSVGGVGNMLSGNSNTVMTRLGTGGVSSSIQQDSSSCQSAAIGTSIVDSEV